MSGPSVVIMKLLINSSMLVRTLPSRAWRACTRRVVPGEWQAGHEIASRCRCVFGSHCACVAATYCDWSAVPEPVQVVEFHDDATGQHTRRVGELTVAIAQHLSQTGKLIQIYSDAELFEARRPKYPAVISEIDGTVQFGATGGDPDRIGVDTDVVHAFGYRYVLPVRFGGRHFEVGGEAPCVNLCWEECVSLR